MAYNKNVPGSGQSLGETRSIIQGNFEEIDDAFKVNHIDLGTAGQGKHPFLQMPNQSSAPTTAANEGAMYVLTNQLFFREQSNGTQQQISGSVISGTFGECPLFGGLGLKWGISQFINGGATIDYTTVGLTDFSTNTYAVVATPAVFTTSSNLRYFTTSLTKESFVGNTSANINFNWIAIGE